MSQVAKILIVDDDADTVRLLSYFLKLAGHQIVTAGNGAEGLRLAEAERPDLVILDWQLPEMDGLEVCRQLRARSPVQILMLTSKDAVADRVEGLMTGADDYVIKPFAPEEIMARVGARLRLRAATAPAPGPINELRFEDVRLSDDSHEAWRGERPLGLSTKEFALLRLFLQRPRHVLRRRELLAAVWGDPTGYESNVLDVYVGYLRQKLEAGGEPRVLHTRRGVGFYLGDAP